MTIFRYDVWVTAQPSECGLGCWGSRRKGAAAPASHVHLTTSLQRSPQSHRQWYLWQDWDDTTCTSWPDFACWLWEAPKGLQLSTTLQEAIFWSTDCTTATAAAGTAATAKATVIQEIQCCFIHSWNGQQGIKKASCFQS